MDAIDTRILAILQKDCTVSVKDIAREVGLSYTPTYERIRHMEDSGVIRAKAAILDPSKVGINLFAYCNVVLKEQSKEALLQFEESVSALPEVMEVLSLSGVYDYMLRIASRDIRSYNEFIVNKLADIPNIGQYHSHIVMSTVKSVTAYPITSD
jgi:Lrp/AsnC family transcriptional regulator, leucine-responsive regulatory protein